MVPSFELKDVTLLDAQDRVALRLPKVLIALSPRSLWRFGLHSGRFRHQPQFWLLGDVPR
jgi:hypothetical protein